MRRFNRIGSIIGLALGLGISAARADVVAVVSSRSPVSSLSKNQIADIFLGKAARFPDGSLAMPIDQAEGTGPRKEFYLQFTGKSAAQLKAHWSKVIFTGRGQPPKSVSSSVELKKRLLENPQAIGYMESDAVDGSVKVLLAAE